MSRVINDNSHDLIVCYNYLLYYKLFYKYIVDFKKDLKFFLYELQYNYLYLMKFKDLNAYEYILKTINFFNDIIKNSNSSNLNNYINKDNNYFIIYNFN